MEVAKKNLSRIVEEVQWQSHKEEQLANQTKDRRVFIEEREEEVIKLDSRERDVASKLSGLQSELLRLKHSTAILDHDVPAVKRDVDRLMDQKNQMLLR